MANDQNLTPWKPGVSGNPAGYSSGRRLTTALVKMIEDKGADNAIVVTWMAMALGDRTVLKGRTPDWRFFKELLDRIDGKVPDRIIDETPDDDEVILKWEDANAPDYDAAAASGPAGGEDAHGPIQNAGLRPEMGQDATGRGPLP